MPPLDIVHWLLQNGSMYCAIDSNKWKPVVKYLRYCFNTGLVVQDNVWQGAYINWSISEGKESFTTWLPRCYYGPRSTRYDEAINISAPDAHAGTTVES